MEAGIEREAPEAKDAYKKLTRKRTDDTNEMHIDTAIAVW
jgi:hypothetical protein